MCVVGEWLGDTGDESFAAALLADWTLIRRVPLPNWTDTVHELTIWQRLPAKSSGRMTHSCSWSSLQVMGMVYICRCSSAQARPGIPAV